MTQSCCNQSCLANFSAMVLSKRPSISPKITCKQIGFSKNWIRVSDVNLNSLLSSENHFKLNDYFLHIQAHLLYTTMLLNFQTIATCWWCLDTVQIEIKKCLPIVYFLKTILLPNSRTSKPKVDSN